MNLYYMSKRARSLNDMASWLQASMHMYCRRQHTNG